MSRPLPLPLPDPGADAGADPEAGADATAETECRHEGLYARLKAYEGRAAAVGGVGKDPVNEPMIRHWCEAMGDANPAYTGAGAVAPPTMLQAWTMGGLSGHGARSGAYDALLELLDGAGYTAVVATDCEQEYLRPLRPGDRITFDALIESVSQRKTTKLGTGYFVTTRMEVRAEGELAGTHRFRILKYRPAGRHQPQSQPQPQPQPLPLPRPRPRSRPRDGASEGAEGAGSAEGGSAVARPARPRPVVNRDNAGFWAGVSRHRLLIQRCAECGKLRFPWLPGCNACGCLEWDTVEAAGEGTVHSYVVMHHPPFPAFDPPYAVVLVELAEGVRMISNVVGVPHDRVRIGMPVRLVFERVDGELELPLFRPAEEAEGTEEAKGTEGTDGTEGTEGTEEAKGNDGTEGTEEARGARGRGTHDRGQGPRRARAGR